MTTPRYTYPLQSLPRLIIDLLTGTSRSFRMDALSCIRRLTPPLRVYGEENIPSGGPCVLTVNHYHRPGFGAWWIAFAIASSVPVEMHWVMTGELTFPGKWYAFLGKPVSRWLLDRAGGMYGFTTMPPMPPRQRDIAARARSVRTVLEYIRRKPTSLVAFAPEGGDNPGGVLSKPPGGVGRFLLLLAQAGFMILPTGCWEEQDTLCLRFGEPYRLEVPHGQSPDKKDMCAAGILMHAIAEQLPMRLRGEFT